MFLCYNQKMKEGKINLSKILIATIVILSIPLFFLINKDEKKELIIETQQTETKELKKENFCYYLAENNKEGYDITWLKIEKKDKYLTGQYEKIPFTTDSKRGVFEGIVDFKDQGENNHSTVISNTTAEGSEIKEELKFVFNNMSAQIGYGEKINTGDGIYKYYNKENISFSKQLEYIECGDLEEKLLVEKYIKENIATISKLKPVLGGNWYVVSVYVLPKSNNGEVIYEDGHISTKATFEYEYTQNPESVKIINFKNIK